MRISSLWSMLYFIGTNMRLGSWQRPYYLIKIGDNVFYNLKFFCTRKKIWALWTVRYIIICVLNLSTMGGALHHYLCPEFKIVLYYSNKLAIQHLSNMNISLQILLNSASIKIKEITCTWSHRFETLYTDYQKAET